MRREVLKAARPEREVEVRQPVGGGAEGGGTSWDRGHLEREIEWK